jgi:glutamate synthase (NADPH/NADH) large chain
VRLKSRYWEQLLIGLIEEHAAETGSRHAKRILQQWDITQSQFWQICPKEMLTRLKHPLSDEPTAVRA